MKNSTRFAGLLMAAGLLVGAAACGDKKTDDASSATTAQASLKVTGAWSRATAPTAKMGAIYLKIDNSGAADRLTAVSVPSSVAGTAEMHTMQMADDHSSTTMAGAHDDHSSTTMAGARVTTTMAGAHGSTTMAGAHDDHSSTTMGTDPGMKMVQVDGFDVPAKGSLELKPGGNHIMLMDLAKQLKAGDTFDLEMTFKSGTKLTQKIEVKEQP
jgi:copper(I)-binding protein